MARQFLVTVGAVVLGTLVAEWLTNNVRAVRDLTRGF